MTPSVGETDDGPVKLRPSVAVPMAAGRGFLRRAAISTSFLNWRHVSMLSTVGGAIGEICTDVAGVSMVLTGVFTIGLTISPCSCSSISGVHGIGMTPLTISVEPLPANDVPHVSRNGSSVGWPASW